MNGTKRGMMGKLVTDDSMDRISLCSEGKHFIVGDFLVTCEYLYLYMYVCMYVCMYV